MISSRRIGWTLALCLATWVVHAQTEGPLPQWTLLGQDAETLEVAIPTQLQMAAPDRPLKRIILDLDPAWAPSDWRAAAFDLKGLVVTLKTRNGVQGDVAVGIRASKTQLDAMMGFDMAAYLDGYIYTDEPYIPDADATGKLWLRTTAADREVLGVLLDAASLGVPLVLFEDLSLNEAHRAFLDVIAGTSTGSLDVVPDVTGLDADRLSFFFNPGTGDYHVALYAPSGEVNTAMFTLGQGAGGEVIYPEGGDAEVRQYGRRTELVIRGGSPYYFFKIEPAEKNVAGEQLQIVERKTIDPYELVVRNQVFKDQQSQIFENLIVDEELNYRYTTPAGFAIDVTYEDTVFIRKDQPIERLRRAFYLGGVKWRNDELPELPLIQPEKVQSAPLNIELDKTYAYAYEGEDVIDGFPTWQVGFKPTGEGDFYAGTVWIDQQTGAYRRIRATQSGLEAPVIGNEITVEYDWVEIGGERFWAQVREFNLQIVNVVGVRLVLQIDNRRSNYRFNDPNYEQELRQAYDSDMQMLRDTDQGFRYLIKENGERVVTEDTFGKRRAGLGGIFYDPATGDVTPLGGFNYTDLDFLDKGWQANFFVAGAVNDLIVSDPDFMGKGWDLTAELFLSAIDFTDRIFENGREVEELELENLRESFNLTLGIPLGDFFKFSANYSLRYLDFDLVNDRVFVEENGFVAERSYTPPEQTLENIGRFSLAYSRGRFNTEIEYEIATRTDWEQFGFLDGSGAPLETNVIVGGSDLEVGMPVPQNSAILVGRAEPFEDTYRKFRFDASISERLPRFQTLEADVRYLKGWDLDRFSRFGFGFFENSVAGFGSSGAEGDEAVRLRLEYAVGVQGLFNIDFELEGARAWNDDNVYRFLNEDVEVDEAIDFGGIGVAANFLGPWDILIRADVGYGLFSDLEGEEGDITGQLVFLKLF